MLSACSIDIHVLGVFCPRDILWTEGKTDYAIRSESLSYMPFHTCQLNKMRKNTPCCLRCQSLTLKQLENIIQVESSTLLLNSLVSDDYLILDNQTELKWRHFTVYTACYLPPGGWGGSSLEVWWWSHLATPPVMCSPPAPSGHWSARHQALC